MPINFGKTVYVDNEEEFEKELKRNAPKNPEKLAEDIKRYLKGKKSIEI